MGSRRPPTRSSRSALGLPALAAAVLCGAVLAGAGIHALAAAEEPEASAVKLGLPVEGTPLAPDGGERTQRAARAARAVGAAPASPRIERRRSQAPGPPRIDWRNSEAIGTPEAGRLRHGVALPASGRYWVSWDPVLRRSPSRRWRRFGTDRLLRTTLAIMREVGVAHPGASRVAIGDLSRPQGGEFGPRWGYIGHVTHQNGLDIDVYYPRRDGRERPPESVDQVDVGLAQELVDRFVAAGAETVYVGPNLPLEGPAGVVIPAANHDNHLHARLPPEG